MPYIKFTKSLQATGSENIGRERALLGFLARRLVNSPPSITLENNGKIRPEPDRENAFARASGGESGIRTRETVSRLHAFQACAFDHSATSPCNPLWSIFFWLQDGIWLRDGFGSKCIGRNGAMPSKSFGLACRYQSARHHRRRHPRTVC